MDNLRKRLRTRRKFRLGDIIMSPLLGVCELIVDVEMKNGEITYGTMYIEGLCDGVCSMVRLTDKTMPENMKYEVLYNVFDRRNA